MHTLAVFVCPERIGVSRVKSAGSKPMFTTPLWRNVENVEQLLSEPAMLASIIRDMADDDAKYQIYMNIWPGAFKAVMFSHDKRSKSDVDRLRKSELDIVFHGDLSDQYTYDLLLDKGRPSFGGKSRRVIYTFPQGRLKLMIAAFSAVKMKLKRIAPMDVAMCEAALRYWAPKGKKISATILLDEACTTIAFMRRGAIQALRTIPNGCNSVLSSYMQITGQGIDECLEMIKSNGVNATEDNEMPTIQDNLMRVVNKLVGEVVKLLHTTFGDDAVMDKVLLCGNFVDTVDLVPYMNTMLGMECETVSAGTLKAKAAEGIVLNGDDLARLFPFACTTCEGVDLLSQYVKSIADRNKAIVLCTVVSLIIGGLMILTPLEKKQLEEQRDASAAIMNQPEFVRVKELMDKRKEVLTNKQNLIDAIENLPHGQTNTAGIISDVLTISSGYGTVSDISVDYSGKTISMKLITNSYESFIYWQQEITKDGRFSFVQPPSFNGNGSVYNVAATLKATDFDRKGE